MGRPAKEDGNRREKMIGFYVTSEEFEHLRQRAFSAKKTVAAYVRDVVLSTPPKPKSTK